MLQMIGTISFIFGAIFALLLLLSLFQSLKKKSLKARKKVIVRRRFYGVAALFFVIVGIVLSVGFQESNMKSKEFEEELTPQEVYEQTESFESLPDAIFAAGDDYYIKNGNNQIFGYLKMETETEDEEETELQYESGLCYEDGAQVGGGKDFLALRSADGSLSLKGAFEYQTYEKDPATFEGEKISEDCSFLDANSNNLFYVENGTLYSVGYNAFGVLGDGTERNRLESSAILENVATVSVSSTHVLVVDIYGNLYGFGDNSYSEMGNRTTAQSTTPVKLMSGVKQAQAGKYFSIVLTKDGEVLAAGRNHMGQLGTEDDRDYATYMKIMDGICKISVKENSCAALTPSGTLYAWGDNGEHQLGLGEKMINKPTKVMSDVYDMAMGESSMGILTLDRDVAITGTARESKGNQYIETLYQLDGDVPEEYLYRETVVMPSRKED